MSESEIKQQVRHFYDQVGWQVGDDGLYQNARYEDLRPVAREYIHRCHLRVAQFLKPTGRFLLDAGSGPIQYPEYLVYSQDYNYRVCADLSMVALLEARQRIGEKGLFVVADIANLPFKADVFESEVSLHMIHHLPPEDHLKVYDEFYRVLAPSGSAVLVNGWSYSSLMVHLNGLVWFMEKVMSLAARWRKPAPRTPTADNPRVTPDIPTKKEGVPTGTYVKTFDPAWMDEHLKGRIPFEIRAWRSLSTPFLRRVIQPWNGGRFWLRLVYWLEDHFPHAMGRNGQYPLIVIRKPLEK